MKTLTKVLGNQNQDYRSVIKTLTVGTNLRPNP